MNIDKTYLGRNVQSFEQGDTLLPVDQVIINYCTDTDGTTYSATAGTHSTGRILEKTIQTVTSSSVAQAIATALLAKYSSDPYLPVTISGSELDPATELGDAMTVNGVYTGIGSITTDFSKGMIADLEAQGQPEEDDFPYLNSVSRKAERQTANIYSKISVNATNIELEAGYRAEADETLQDNIDDCVKTTELNAKIGTYIDSATGTAQIIQNVSGTYLSKTDAQSTYETIENVAEISAEVDSQGSKIELVVSTSGSTSTVNTASIVSAVNNSGSSIMIDADKIQMTGTTTFLTPSDVGSSGSTVIDGGRITTGTISANRLDLSGCLTASDVGASGSTVIDGGRITTGTISAARLELTDYLTVSAGDTRYDASGSASSAVSGLQTSMASGTTTISGGCITTGTIVSDRINFGGICYIYDSSFSEQEGWFGYGTIRTPSWYDTGCGVMSFGSLVLGSAYYAYVGGGNNYYTQLQEYLAGSNSFRPSADDTYDLGSTATRWQDIYATNTVIQTSDRELKKDITYTFDMDSFFDSLKPCSYKFKNGNSGRTHWGMIAQDIEDSLADCGLTSMDFAGFCKSTKVTTELQTDELGEHYHDVEHEGLYDYGLRYEEFIALCISQIQKLKARVAQLEANSN